MTTRAFVLGVFALLSFCSLNASTAFAKEAPCEGGWEGMVKVGSKQQVNESYLIMNDHFGGSTFLERCTEVANQQLGKRYDCFAQDPAGNCRAGFKKKHVAQTALRSCLKGSASQRDAQVNAWARQFAQGESSVESQMVGDKVVLRAYFKNVPESGCASGCREGFGSVARTNLGGRACENDASRALVYQRTLSSHTNTWGCECVVNFVARDRSGASSSSYSGRGQVREAAGGGSAVK